MPNKILAIFVLLYLGCRMADFPDRVIRLRQRPILVFHGMLTSCKESQYSETQSRPHVICFETGEYEETQESFEFLAEQSCKRLHRMVKKHPKHFENGFYVMAASQGGLIARYMLQSCPLFRTKLKRLITKGTPHLGAIDGPVIKENTGKTLEPRLVFFSAMTVFKKLILTQISKDEGCSINDMLGDKLGSASVIRKISSQSKKTRHSEMLGLELMVNVIHSDDSIVIPPKSTIFGANYDAEADTLQPFYETPAYKINYIGLRTMYRTGRMMNCVVHGDHARVPIAAEDDHLYELLNDNCLFDPKYYDYIPDHELYRHCLALKIMRSPKTRVLQCDPSRLDLSQNKRFMRRVSGIKVEQKIIA